MNNFSVYIIPSVVTLVIVFGMLRKVPIFENFLIGAKEGLMSTVSIAPSIIGLITAVTMLTASGVFDVLSNFLSPIANFFNFPTEILPLMFLRPISGSGSLALVNSIFGTVGPDSFAGRVASVLMSSTETTFYTIAVYFGAVGIKNTKYALKCALIIDLISFILSVVSVKLLF